MKKIALTLIVFGSLFMANATDSPDVRYLKFDELSSNFNTTNAKGQILKCRSAFDVYLPEGRFTQEGIDILIPLTANTKNEKILFLQWDYKGKEWLTIKGKKVGTKTINGQKYHLVHVNQTGVYGLFENDRATGNVKVILAPSLRLSRVEFSQKNVQVNFEKQFSSKVRAADIPFGDISILADLTMDVYLKDEVKAKTFRFKYGEIPNFLRRTNKKNNSVVYIRAKDLKRISNSSTPNTSSK
jgi:hypothetical protein